MSECKLGPCGHCESALVEDHCGLPEHRYCVICDHGSCYSNMDKQLSDAIVKRLDVEKLNAELTQKLDSAQKDLANWKDVASTIDKDYDRVMKQRDDALLQVGELVSALQHMKMCGSCGEDSWNLCEGGRQAQAALDKATVTKKRIDDEPISAPDARSEADFRGYNESP